MDVVKGLVRYTKKLLVVPPQLTPEDLYHAIGIIIEALAKEATLEAEEVLQSYILVSSFLTSLRTTGLDHKAEYIAEAAKAVLRYSDTVDLSSHVREDEVVLDIVGTGGDGQNTFNVSTSAAIVAAGIPGLRVCKHGGKASTSNSGAGDLIAKLGCDVSKVNQKTVATLWHSGNTFLFLLAPYFHNGMKMVAKVRQLIGIPTIFNVLGPLVHPVSHVNRRILGVYSRDLAPEYARAAALVYPTSEIFVVWGHIGLDEVSPVGGTTVWHVDPSKPGNVDTFELRPDLFGLQEHELAECKSLGPAENAHILKDEILAGRYRLGDNNPIYDYILLNTAVLYCLSQGNKDWKLGVEKAEESIQSGSALNALNRFLSEVQNI
ncbi:hypothetical protein HG536_0E00790 [Torulaspora globosa]|uniref:Anthranilate phosphoribosyltransferase n=1 Tax=Torulaspora globosa TaxID=48254 RepID=A0A7G3ZI32_9SACH|nr:uncharacterized protein HG536_0E00790 [Torulaspora globosa]QLL33168.1 hypothetical protein HG536_0E00790 [Torulaspora globosa]